MPLKEGVMTTMALTKVVMTMVTAEAVVTDNYLVIMCACCCSKQFIFKESVPNTVIWQSARLSIPCLQDPVFPTAVVIVGWLLRLFFKVKYFPLGGCKMRRASTALGHVTARAVASPAWHGGGSTFLTPLHSVFPLHLTPPTHALRGHSRVQQGRSVISLTRFLVSCWIC